MLFSDVLEHYLRFEFRFDLSHFSFDIRTFSGNGRSHLRRSNSFYAICHVVMKAFPWPANDRVDIVTEKKPVVNG